MQCRGTAASGACPGEGGFSGSAEKSFQQDEEDFCKIARAKQLVKGNQSRQHECFCSFQSFRAGTARSTMDTAEQEAGLQENSGKLRTTKGGDTRCQVPPPEIQMIFNRLSASR